MSKNILIVLDGGRANGNTAQLANAFKAGAEETGHQLYFATPKCNKMQCKSVTP